MQFVVRDYTQMKRMAEELLPVELQPNVNSYFTPLEFWSAIPNRNNNGSDVGINKRAGELFVELWKPPVFNDGNVDASMSFNRVNMIAQHKCGTAYTLSDYGAGNYDNRRERLRLYKLLKRVLFMYRSGELKGDFVVHKTRANSGPQNTAQWPVKMEAYGGFEYWFITGHIQWIMSMRQQLSLKNRETIPEFFGKWFKTNKVAESKLHQLQKANEDERARFINRVDYIRILKELFRPAIWSDYTIDVEMPRFGVLLYRNGKAYATFMGDYQTRHNINVNGNRKLDKFPSYLSRAMDTRMWKERVIKLENTENNEVRGLFDIWSESLPNPADMWPEEDTED